MSTNIPYKFTFDQLIGPKYRRMLVLVVGLLAMAVATIFFTVYLNTIENPTTDTSDRKTSSDEDELIHKELNQLKVLGLTKLVQQAELIQKDLGKFDAEAAQYHKRFAELLTSTKAGALATYQGITDYFRTHWDEKLPDQSMSGHHRQNLGILLKTVREAIERDKGYVPNQLTYDQFDGIALKAKEGKRLYRAHNQLLDALSRRIGEGPQAPPDTIKAEVLKLEDEVMFRRLTDKSWMEEEEIPFLPAEERQDRPTRIPSTSQDGMKDLYRQENEDK